MKKILISEKTLKEKIAGCWMGKNIGGTIGAPFEGQKWVNCLDYYSKIPDKAAANDDLDLQLIWLKLIEDKGINPTLREFAEYWKKYASPYPWNEYGFCNRNLARGLVPPVSGCFENHYIDEMGSPIRSEIWACISPGDPQLASSMAWKDSSLDHAGGEGTYGEMFWAAVESAAFVIDDPFVLVDIGLEMIPLYSEVARSIREAVWCHRNNISWAHARQRIIDAFGRERNVCHAAQNHGFTVIGWLYGKDFGDSVCKAVNCGYDTDCTGATLGALLGILSGKKGIPVKWIKPIGEEIAIHRFNRISGPPENIAELTRRTLSIAKKFTNEKSGTVEITSNADSVPGDMLSLLSRNELALKSIMQDPMSSVERTGEIDVWFHYNGSPVIKPGISKTIGIHIERNGEHIEKNISIKCPAGWKIKKAGVMADQKRFVMHSEKVDGINKLHVNIKDIPGSKVSFTMLGPEEAKGFPANTQTERCSLCGAWKGACICMK